MKLKTILFAGSAIILAACSSTPEPAPVTQAPVAQAPSLPSPGPVTQGPVVDQGPIVSAPSGPTFQGPAPGTLDDFLYSSGGEARVYFAYNQYDLNNESRDALRRQASWLQTYSNVNAVVEGNADERGTREYNLALGARRAESVKSFLVSQGVSPTRLTTVSYGKERPIDGRSTEDGWSRNRNSHTNLMSGSIG